MAKKKLDPVTQYARDVVDGRIVAARLVVLACKRHLRDLEQQADKGLEWRPDAAQEVIDFFAEVLVLPDEDEEGQPLGTGKPFILSPFQQFIAGSLFGWYTADGYRRFRVAYIETGKGSGKTPFGAGLLIYGAAADGQRGGQCYCAAVTREQARLAFVDAENMVAASPDLRELFQSTVNNLAVAETGCYIRAISAEKKGLDGKRVHMALLDEIHEHPSNVVVVKMRAGTKNRRNALIIEITNSGFDQKTVCWEHHELSREVLEGTVVNEAWFAFVCHLDSCARHHAEGHYQPLDDCPDCDDWKVEGPHWLKPNPNLGQSLTWQYLREQVADALHLPSQRNMVRRLNFCQWTQQVTVWIPPESWAKCRGAVSSASLVGRDCFLGVDVSDKIDLSSVVAIFPRPLERALPPQSADEPAPSVSDTLRIDRAIDVLAFFWMPAATLQRRAEEDKTPYLEWSRQKFITATAGSMVDHDAIVDFIITQLAKKYRLLGIGIDQSGASAIITRLRREYGDEPTDPLKPRFVNEIPQGFRRQSDPSKVMEALVMSGNVTHDGNPVMAECMRNMAKDENTWREIRPIKIDQRKRIDGGVALINGIAQMLLTGVVQESVYLTRGVRTLGE